MRRAAALFASAPQPSAAMRKVRVGGHVVMPIEKCVAVMVAGSSGGADAAPVAGRILAPYQTGSI